MVLSWLGHPPWSNEKPRIWKFKLVHLTGQNDMFQVMFQRYRFRVRPPHVDNDSISKSVRDRLVCRLTYSYRYIWTSKPSVGFQFEILEVFSFPSWVKFVELEWLIMILIDWKRSPSIISLIYPNTIIADFNHLTSLIHYS